MGPELASQSVDMAPLLLLEPMLHMDMLPVDTMLLTLLELFMLPRERLRLNQRLMLFMALTDMVLDTLPTQDLSMEDTPATMAREMLRPNQRLMLMLSTELMDMVLATLPTPDLSMEDTPPTPDPLSPAMLPDQLFPLLDTLPTLDQSMEDTPATMARERLRLMLFMATMDMVLDTLPTPDQFMEDTPPIPDPLFPLSIPDLLSPLSTPDQLSPLSTLEESMDTTKPASNQKDNQRH